MFTAVTIYNANVSTSMFFLVPHLQIEGGKMDSGGDLCHLLVL